MKRLGILAIALAALTTGCADWQNNINRELFENTSGDYHIIKWSGGHKVEEYWLHSIKVTQNERTDGVFFIYKGNIIDVQGDVTSIRLERGFEGPDQLPDGLFQPAAPQPSPIPTTSNLIQQ